MQTIISILSPEGLSYDPEEVSRRESAHDNTFERIDALIAQTPFLSAKSLRRNILSILTANARLSLKRQKLLRLADQFKNSISNHVPCKSGCNHCCHLITYIYEYEAMILSEASGLKYQRPSYRPREQVIEEAKMYAGQPCPFLADGQCSVYESRPMICRLHHSFNEDATQCKIGLPPEQVIGIAMIDPNCIEQPYHLLNYVKTPGELWGAIQDFFPVESQSTE